MSTEKELCDLFMRAVEIAKQKVADGVPGYFQDDLPMILNTRHDPVWSNLTGHVWSNEEGTVGYQGYCGSKAYFRLECNKDGKCNPKDFSPLYIDNMEIKADGKFPEFFMDLYYRTDMPPLDRNKALRFAMTDLAPELVSELEQILTKDKKVGQFIGQLNALKEQKQAEIIGTKK